MFLPKSAKSAAAFFALAGLLVAGFAAAAVEDEIRARLQPHGEVCEIGEDCAVGLTLGGAAGGAPKDPESVYTTYCFACHGTGANNAPVLGNIEQWAPRIAKGIDALYESAINGFNNGAMPPKGLCADCSDDEVKATVDHIIAQSQ
ncbi:MAG: c-type cytochrome [Pseudomonadota bacterium]|nr:c-type cytochrome [Pseudomonadota bacterium]